MDVVQVKAPHLKKEAKEDAGAKLARSDVEEAKGSQIIGPEEMTKKRCPMKAWTACKRRY